MTTQTFAALTAALALTACATTAPADDSEPLPLPEGSCDASEVQAMIGERATSELGAELLRRTGAEILRWVPPRTAVTMDYRPDRLTVSYDDEYVIERISCG